MFRHLAVIWHKSTMLPGQCTVYSRKYGHNRRRLVLLRTYKNCSCSLVSHYPLSHTYLSPYDRWHAVSVMHRVMLHRNPLPGLEAGSEVTSQWLDTQARKRATQASWTGAPLSAAMHWGWTAIQAHIASLLCFCPWSLLLEHGCPLTVNTCPLSVKASQITWNKQMPVKHLVQASNKYIITLHYWPFVRESTCNWLTTNISILRITGPFAGNPLVTGGSPHKGPVMREMLLCQDLTMPC